MHILRTCIIIYTQTILQVGNPPPPNSDPNTNTAGKMEMKLVFDITDGSIIKRAIIKLSGLCIHR